MKVDRPFAGMRKGHAYQGMNRHRIGETRLVRHWIDNGGGRFFGCDCMPAFRVGDERHDPRRVKGRKAKLRYYRKTWRPCWRLRQPQTASSVGGEAQSNGLTTARPNE